MRDTKLKVVCKLANIPDASTIQKVTGNVKYIVSRYCTFHTGTEKKDVVAEDGCAFLLNIERPSTNISCVSADMEVIWHTTLGTIMDLFEEDK